MTAPVGNDATQAVPGAERIREIGLAAWASNQHRAAALTVLVGGADRLRTEADRLEARAIAHQLIGSAGTFGHEHVSEVARDVSTVLNQSELTATDRSRLVDLMATITTDLEQEPEIEY